MIKINERMKHVALDMLKEVNPDEVDTVEVTTSGYEDGSESLQITVLFPQRKVVNE